MLSLPLPLTPFSSSMGPSIKMSHSGATAQNGHQEDDDDDMALFHLDEACLLENPSLQKCLIPFDQLIIQEEIGQGLLLGWILIVGPSS